MDARTRDIQAGYDRVASRYAATIFDELKDKPFDRGPLDRFVDNVLPIGPACDLGCGPGQVARYLHEQGLPVFGLDLSSEMVAHARRLNFFFFTRSEIERGLQESGFDIVQSVEREAYADVEHQSRRAYLLARKPEGGEYTGAT